MNNQTQTAWDKIKLAIEGLSGKDVYDLAQRLEIEAGDIQEAELNKEEDADLTPKELQRKYEDYEPDAE